MIHKMDIEDPNYPYASCLMTLYSMETFLQKNLNYSIRTHDENKFVSLGPFSIALFLSIPL
jgi:hypothetical protein